MKFIGCSDLHIGNHKPVNRKGEYWLQVLDKFNFILKTTVNETDILVVAGDFFDSPTVPYKVTKEIIDLITAYKEHKYFEILVVPGQHDLRWHTSGLDNSPLGILWSAGCVEILQNGEEFIHNGVSFIGAGWNEEPEKEADVIVMHRMITHKKTIQSWQEESTLAMNILKKYPWAKCIISGDNHIPHILKTKSGKLQINCGSMMRTTKIQLDHKPAVYLIDSSNWTSKTIKIPVLSTEEVFDFNKIEEQENKDESKKKAEEMIAKFINTLPKEEQERPNFSNVLNSVIDQIKPNQRELNIINNIMEKVN